MNPRNSFALLDYIRRRNYSGHFNCSRTRAQIGSDYTETVWNAHFKNRAHPKRTPIKIFRPRGSLPGLLKKVSCVTRGGF